ncbi:MAG: hypothetical protein QGG67_16750 [Gammaproteobacteria bacterium]|jgi:hypothetical protein|nr:hypothetical protein [Gammaproteobacteria bacterium]HJO10576.1 hypothetical protein [Gammaproteobacteria bacterium]
MQRSLSSIRTDIPGVVIGLALALLIALLNFQSTGIVRGGEDEGSGFGGTGRAVTPGGGSGFGGTGLKPFLGMNSANEVIIIQPGLELSDAIPLQEPVPMDLVVALTSTREPVQSRHVLTSEIFRTTDSAPLNITEALQAKLDINALLYEHHPILSSAAPITATASYSVRADSAPAIDDELSTTDSFEPADDSNTTNWNAFTAYLAEQRKQQPQQDSGQVATNMGAVLAVDRDQRLARPERIQRPQLPPIQRVRPIARPTVLPPRIKPMRL